MMIIQPCLRCAHAGTLTLGNKVQCQVRNSQISVREVDSCSTFERDEVKEASVVLTSIANICSMHPAGGDLNAVIGKIEDRVRMLKDLIPDV